MDIFHGIRSHVNVAVFAKAPVAGLAKTRLIPTIGAQAAADLQQHLIARTLAIAIGAKVGPVSLWCTPNRKHTAFADFAREHPIVRYDQSDGDLGQRMHHAFEALTPFAPLLLIGVDCPPLTRDHLRTCAERLLDGEHSAVLLPTEDGGYALIGLRQPQWRLFESIPWGTAMVMGLARQRLTECAMTWSEPDVLWDLDRPEDLKRWKDLADDGL